MLKSFGIENFVFIIYIGIISAIYMLPDVNFLVGTQSLSLMTLPVLLVFSKEIKNIIKAFGLALGYVVLMFLIAEPFNLKYGLFANLFYIWTYIFPLVLSYILYRRRNFWEFLASFVYLFVFVLVITQNTLIAMMEYPNIMRILTNGNTEEDFRTMMVLKRVGGYGFAYGCGSLSILCVSQLFQWKSLNWKLIILLVFLGVASITIIIESQFTTLLLLVLCSIVFCLYNTGGGKIKKIIAFLIVAIIVIWGEQIITFLLPYFSDSIVGIRLEEIRASYYWGQNVEDARADYRYKILEEWLYSPIWGTDISSGNQRFLWTHSHSTLLSVLLSTGLIGLYCYFGSHIHIYRKIYFGYDKQVIKSYFYPQILYFLLLSFFNPTSSPEYCFITFFMILVMIKLILHFKQEKLIK